MERVYLGLGSNLGDREANLRFGLARLALIGEVGPVSAFHETRAEVLPGAPSQPDYLNAAALLRTDMPPDSLLEKIKDIERAAGRDLAAPRWSPRPLDIDILLYGTLEMNTPDLTIPHPRMASRDFVLDPLSEIAPELIRT
ncbi:2-amino-4-hydroxy-6-hydroxymethyldihydropteridine diphosphokinase [bacterium]|nr:2-amino-4-hydroxy-6-hydroxymethyldihydropteridine diphosphokinase [bacterium]